MDFKKIGLYLLLLITHLCAYGSNSSNNAPLPADKAFMLSISAQNAQQINAQWEIAPGYYLYRKHIHVKAQPNVIADIQLPQGKVKQDLNHAEYEVYVNSLTLPIFLKTPQSQIELTIEYRGCSEQGFCYPPTHKTQTFNLQNMQPPPFPPQPQASGGHASFMQLLLTDQNRVNDLLNTQSFFMTLLIFGLLGLLLSFTPCVLPMIPILTSIIAGHKQVITTKKAFILSLTYVLASSFTYALAGMATAYMGSSLQVWLQKPWIVVVASGIFVLLSLSLFGLYDLRLPRYWQNKITSISRKQEGGTYTGVFIMGVISTLIVSPCVTAPLIGVLMYIAQTGNMLLGASALFALGLGMGVPLILIGVSAGKWLPRRGPWMKLVQYFFGMIMLVMAFWLISRVFSVPTITIFLAILLLSLAIYLSLYHARFVDYPFLYRSLGCVAGLIGMALIIAVTAPSSLTTYLSVNKSVNQNVNHGLEAFTVISSLDDLNRELSIARASHKPVLLDFYADWCESCVLMDKNVFNDPDVITSLSQFVLLRADLSKNNDADAALLKNYGVIAPPTILFFNAQGKEVNSQRVVGELSAHEFLMRINTFITASCDKEVSC